MHFFCGVVVLLHPLRDLVDSALNDLIESCFSLLFLLVSGLLILLEFIERDHLGSALTLL